MRLKTFFKTHWETILVTSLVILVLAGSVGILKYTSRRSPDEIQAQATYLEARAVSLEALDGLANTVLTEGGEFTIQSAWGIVVAAMGMSLAFVITMITYGLYLRMRSETLEEYAKGSGPHMVTGDVLARHLLADGQPFVYAGRDKGFQQILDASIDGEEVDRGNGFEPAHAGDGRAEANGNPDTTTG